jgi:NADH-quinone oxidoreductase subunit C
MDASLIFETLKSRLGDAILEFDSTVKSPFIRVSRERFFEVMQALRDEPDLSFDFLQLVTGLDYPDRFVAAYHLASISRGHAIAIKVDLPRTDPSIDSVAALWPAADWHEREQYDLMGIDFKGHPGLRRILCPEDWEGHPLRKDYVQPDEYHGISNARRIGDDWYPKPDEDSKAIQQYKAPKPASAKETVSKTERDKEQGSAG